MMDEPSVLDYVKSKLKFWRKSPYHLPPVENKTHLEEGLEETNFAGEELVELIPGTKSEPTQKVETQTIPPQPEHANEPGVKSVSSVPWLTILALILGLAAQRSLEPSSNRGWITAVILYSIVTVLLTTAYFRKEWVLPSLQKNEGGVPFAIRIDRNALIIGIPLALLTFLAFGGGMFTGFNLLLWILTIGAFIKAFWIPQPQAIPWYQRFREKLRQPHWQISFTWWTVLVFVVAAIVLFYRYFQILQVPSDMISDHAEKLLDIFDVLHGKPGVFFPRNTGREFIQFYLTAGIIVLFKTGYTYLSLKLGTIFVGVATLPFVYLLGKELANKRVGLVAVFFAGIAYWPNLISRIGLRFPLYPMFVAPTFYFLLRGIRRRKINDFILSGVFLGFGLNGYTPVRVLPAVVVVAIIVYLLHRQSKGARKQTILALVILAVVAIIFIIPLSRYAVDNPQIVFYRTLTRIGTEERPFPGPPVQIFLSNFWSSIIMPFWSDGTVWVNSIPGRPALDVITAALFLMGCVMIFIRYLREKNWVDLFLLVSIPLLMMSSILSLAFPDENPSLNRSGGAYIPIFIIIAIAFDSILISVKSHLPGWSGIVVAGVMGAFLVGGSMIQNYNLVFNEFSPNYTQSAWNTSEMGQMVRSFVDTYGSIDNAYVVAFPYWVDTRLVGINAGFPTLDMGIWPENFGSTTDNPGAKLFLINPQDGAAIDQLKKLYPSGILWLQNSKVDATKDFYVFLVPPDGGNG